jgi:chemotaxis protein MotB
MTDDSQRPIIIKRKKVVAGGHHGGAWKIAYADFVTAMMAFFLLMWLLGSTSKGDLSGIAEYFKNPMKVSLRGGDGSGDSSSVIRGGGPDLTRSEGQRKSGDLPEEKRVINIKAASAQAQQIEMIKLKELKGRIEQMIDTKGALRALRSQVSIEISNDGLRVQLVDENNRPMFDSGSAVLKPYTVELLRELGAALNLVGNRVTLAGHTDAMPFPGKERGYSNWELSADRANAARRALVAGGMDELKVVRVVGTADAILFDRIDPLAAGNRRISIVVLNSAAEQAILADGRALTLKDSAQLTIAPATAEQPNNVEPKPH